jgi:AcrR family transcriptional regulator
VSRQPDPNRRSEQSRQAILAAAAELCVEIGYAATTVEAIAARAGVGKQTIYRWWPSKAAVLLEYMHQSDDVAADGVRALLEQAIAEAKERLAKAQASGELRVDADLDMVVEIIYGPLYHSWLLRARPLPEAFMKDVLSLVFDGLKPATGRGRARTPSSSSD